SPFSYPPPPPPSPYALPLPDALPILSARGPPRLPSGFLPDRDQSLRGVHRRGIRIPRAVARCRMHGAHRLCCSRASARSAKPPCCEDNIYSQSEASEKEIRGGSAPPFSETVQRYCLAVDRVGRSSRQQSSSDGEAASQLASRSSVSQPGQSRGWCGVAP